VADKATPLSIQGEQQQDHGSVRASEDDVDRYVDDAPDEVLACRERGRHLFPTIRQAGIEFTGVDGDGLFLRRLTCTCCGLAVRVERWEAARRGRRIRYQRVASDLEYRKGPEGQTYEAPPGRGRMTPRQIANSVASQALHGTSLAELRRAATRADTSNGGRNG
jgi:hypothetical protein